MAELDHTERQIEGALGNVRFARRLKEIDLPGVAVAQMKIAHMQLGEASSAILRAIQDIENPR